ncbi:glycosyltransferase family 2 protein [Aaosphaeria arxii CBS 175.79]|uniref:Glycosyltransferase family 2 protein n=1 Tax=Aaosphaeria arxii CBS 175.79 TaxID=1450172 RepID=A0A6A5XVW0_9PLEO|nr:glycosyltransferase family 2 protein [Aaosphaeria arxii CBS 175.79]KAF2016967.1 glycosyltransferase family 2 protein [Aaosphaeria arxii CBS 175.79]
MANAFLIAFLFLFLFRYVRVLANWIASSNYRPVPISDKPTFRPEDVTVIIPTTRFNDPLLHEVVSSALAHPIASLILAAAGDTAAEYINLAKTIFPDARVSVVYRKEPNRREQTAMAVAKITTPVMIISDDHTFFPTTDRFVPSLIAPFDKPLVGAVAPVLEPIHHHHPFSFRGFWNFAGMTYLLRRAHEFLATNSIDGGLSCLSSRFAVFRTCIYADPDFVHQYLNEYLHLPWGRVGPLNADDDKFHTRWLANHGWEIKIQGGPDSIMATENVGVWPNFHKQLIRWNRTTWRSNPRALLYERVSWTRFPYTTYSVLVYSFVRLTALYELALAYFLNAGLAGMGFSSRTRMLCLLTLFLWIDSLKAVKIMPHFRKYPQDVVYFVPYLLLGWYCTLIKFKFLGHRWYP